MSNVFRHFMEMLELGERIALRGEGAQVKTELGAQLVKMREEAIEASRAGGRPAPEPCSHAPPGFRCGGDHDAAGKCLTLEPTEPVEATTSP